MNPSMATVRQTLFAQLKTTRFDLLVIGGGIVGAGIARDAAMRGLKVALVDQGDFAGGTSSKTSKLIHGGLRYLEQGQLHLVTESLQERHRLRTVAPTMVRALPILLPVYPAGRRPVWRLRVGLWLYDLLAAGRRVAPSRVLSARHALEREPALRVDGLRAAGVFADCQMDDARLCLANVLQAASFGAVCVNYARLAAFLKAKGRVCGGMVEDRLGGGAVEIQATAVVNATGPWGDAVRRLSDSDAPRRLAPTKGIHLILPRLARHALFVEARRDRRLFFILPWGDSSLVGTTEGLVDSALEALRANPDEVGYLLDEVNRILPGAHVDAETIIATYAGARPLLAFAGTATAASREYRIEQDRWGLWSVLGGKYTTYRAMARRTVDLLIRANGWRVERCLTDQVALQEEPRPITLGHWRAITAQLDPDLLVRLLARYGASAMRVLELIRQEPALGRRVCPHHDVVAAELAHGLRDEFACTVADLLVRRAPIAWSACQGLDHLSTVADLLQRYGGLPAEAVEGQVEAYHRELAQSLAFRRAVPQPMTVSS